MRERKISGTPLVILLLAALMPGFVPGDGQAAATCNTQAADICAAVTSASMADCDDDGFTDYLECNGFTPTVLNGNETAFNAVSYPELGHFYGYSERANAQNDRTKYLDPSTRDHFVILALSGDSPTGSSNLTDRTYLFQDVAKSNGGLNVTLHFLNDFTNTWNTVDRQVARDSSHRAIRITENAADRTSSRILGLTQPTAKTSDDSAMYSVVYTERVKKFTRDTGCGAGAKTCFDYYTNLGCTNSTTGVNETCLADLYKAYQRQNVVHELVHQMAMARTTNGHYAVDTKVPPNNSVMSEYVYYKAYNGGANVKFFIPQNFLSTDPNNMTLWQRQ